jgi:putative ubiquitin-RnfH superfamily antitoxin RatB of RatAB toxin-antitoxin module
MAEEAGVDGRAEEVASLLVQVCYAETEHQFLRELQVPAGTTVREAIMQSGVTQHLGKESVDNCQVGIYGKLKTLDTVLRERDRVEIYRSLKADPKEARRRRAKKKAASA